MAQQRTRIITYNLVWSIIALDWVEMTQPGSAAGGGGDASAANQLLGNVSLASIDTKVTGLSTAANQASELIALGIVTEGAPATDIASSGLNGRLQRIAQRLSSLITALGSPFQAGASIGNTTFASTIADGASVTLGAKADAKNAATDTTAITAMSVWKQISASVQAIAASVAGTLTVATHGVTGTFWQATQPVSIASMPSTPVTGAFFQATQPVSGTVTTTPPTDATTNLTKIVGTAADVNSGLKSAGTLRVVLATDQPALTNKLLVTPDSVALPANQSVNLNQAAGTALDVNSGTKSAGTIRVVLATDQPALTNKLLVTPDSVALPANQSVNAAQFGGTNVSTGAGAGGAGIPRVTVSNDSNVLITPPTLTKGTQGATGISTQDLKDAGRNVTNIFMAAPIITTVAEVMQSFVAYKSGAVVGATATPAVVTAGKTYRINSIEITYWAATVIGGALVRMRVLAGGVALIGSPLYKTFQVGVPAIFTAGSAMTYVYPYPEGIEIPAGAGIAFGVQGVGADGTTGTITGKIMIVVNGYEY